MATKVQKKTVGGRNFKKAAPKAASKTAPRRRAPEPDPEEQGEEQGQGFKSRGGYSGKGNGGGYQGGSRGGGGGYNRGGGGGRGRQQQNDGDSDFNHITGLFASKSGKSFTVFLKPEILEALANLAENELLGVSYTKYGMSLWSRPVDEGGGGRRQRR